MADVVKDSWHLDKKVPIGILVALLIQTGTIIWWAAGLENRLRNSEVQIGQMLAEKEKADSKYIALTVQLATLNERISAQADTLRRIERALDNKAERK